jgi:hypothetical protein
MIGLVRFYAHIGKGVSPSKYGFGFVPLSLNNII